MDAQWICFVERNKPSTILRIEKLEEKTCQKRRVTKNSKIDEDSTNIALDFQLFGTHKTPFSTTLDLYKYIEEIIATHYDELEDSNNNVPKEIKDEL